MPAPFVHRATLRFSDSDALGHVNNARYLSFLEDARIAFLEAMAKPGDGRFLEAGYIVARIEIDYVRPIPLTYDPIEVTVEVTKLGTKSFALAHTISLNGDVAARALSVLVGYDYVSGSSRVLSEAERAALGAHLATA